MFQSWGPVASTSQDTLVYRAASPFHVVVVFAFAGAAACVLLLEAMLAPPQQQPPAFGLPPHLIGGLFLGLFALVGGACLVIRRSIILDRSLRQVTISWRFLPVHKTVTHSLEGLDLVRWRPTKDGSSVLISLCDPNGTEVRLFSVNAVQDARQFTAEIAGFLEIQAEHCDEHREERILDKP